MSLEDLQKALAKFPSDNVCHCPKCGHNACVSPSYNQQKWLQELKELFSVFQKTHETVDLKGLEQKAKTLSDLFWENNIEWNEWLRMGVTEAKQVALAPKYQGKWVSLEDVTALLMKLVQERDDNKLLVVQAVTKLRAKEEELEGKVLVSRKQLEKALKNYKKIDKTSVSKLWVEGARWVIEFIEKELIKGSGEVLNLALAFADVRKKKKGSGDKK